MRNRIPPPSGYRLGDEVGAGRHDAWQDWMLWLMRRRRLSAEVAPAFSFDARPSARISSSDTQTVSASTVTKVVLDTVDFDNGAVVGSPIADESNSQLVIPEGKSGLWLVTIGIGFNSSLSTGYRDHWLTVNGTKVMESNVALPNLGDVERCFSDIHHLTEGDELEVYCKQQWLGASTLPLPPTSWYKSHLTAARIGAL